MPRLHVSNDVQVKGLTFLVGALAVIAASDIFPAEVRVIAAAIAAGAGGVLSHMRQSGQPSTQQLAEERAERDIRSRLRRPADPDQPGA